MRWQRRPRRSSDGRGAVVDRRERLGRPGKQGEHRADGAADLHDGVGAPRGRHAATVPSRPMTRRLADLTTLRLGGPARRLVEAATEDDVVAAVREADASGEPLLVLAGGSNVVVADDGFPGTAVLVATRGVRS